ncbi:DUF3460 family protein [Extensimonas vulgaris]|uniref:Uncharacterized protein DUF3460 n=1 Tax=Extensimonas vulgaris TaxID=1031594 RepID=A0A369AKR8_9BURK|nr:DUF3460 family protein [Extensimonas vulgaris]RCX09761.1 uncharacterized protein DUF3460 [Extensimonas vulgaris]TWI39391.1 uncharacterized protein DUF3460 [Extensimonas vulgaris]TXD15636.1 DUF3460 family protein [Extensimonas vulgaris]
MSLFRRPDYESEVTQFLKQLKQQKPQLEEQQRAGRALLWDKKVDRSLWREYRAAAVPQKPYVYQTEPSSEH